MKPCFTAQTIDMLWHLEKRQKADDAPPVPTLMSIDRVQQAVAWLRAVQRADGGWGEDVWDACQVLKSLARAGLTAADPNVRSGLDFLRSNIESNWPDRTSYWFGPGFLGSAMECFNRFADQRFANMVLDEVWQYFDENESYFRPVDSSTTRNAPAEWHTACVLNGLRSFGSVAPSRERALRAAAWLARQQTPEGCWSPGHADITAYTTIQVILALAALSESDFHSRARKGADWFISKCDRENASLSYKLMAAAAISRTHVDDMVLQMPLSFVTELRDVLVHYSLQTASLHTEAQMAKAELKSLTSDMDALKAEHVNLAARLSQAERTAAESSRDLSAAHDQLHVLRDQLSAYALKLTANQIALLSVVITIISSLIGILISILLSHH
jgi:hypothetical protein